MLTAEFPVVEVAPVTPVCPFGNKVPKKSSESSWKVVALLIVAAMLARGVIAALVPLLPDETYYWEWSRRLQAGYFDHPPGIALLIAMGTSLFGETTFGVRFGPAIAAVVLHVSIVILAFRLAGPRAAVRAAVLGAVLPFSVLGLALATPDVALLSSAAVALVFLERALSSPLRTRRSLGWWTLTGVALGCAFISKFTAVLLPVSLVAACLVYAPLRARFAEPGPWVASAVALLIFSPVVLWNASMNWIAFRFQINHGFGGTARGTPIARELEMIGGQLGLATPILGVLLLLAVVLTMRNEWRLREYASHTSKAAIRFALASVAITPFIFFAISAWKRPIEPNWPALAYTASVVLLASSRASWANSRWWNRGVALAMVVVFAAAVQSWKPVVPVAPARDPIARAHGWTTLATAVDRARRDNFLDGADTRWVAAERYQDASELAFNLPDQPRVFSLNLAGRANQYDLWEGARDELRPDDAMVATFDATTVGDSLAGVVGGWFASSRRGETVQLRREDGVISERRIWMFRDARSIPTRADVLMSP
ncbi:MAG: glycosyltransferase family 39 protein [Phycisphaerae bacterium]|nr:glycosyltransferase family 39 protein [Gemmatimonadaceae bacterium]